MFAENPNSILDEFSRDFEKGFMAILAHRHGSKRVHANTVYKEYIADKHHIHMNATRWSSLTGLCLHLGREGKAIVDETEKGWFIQYIDRNPALIAKHREAELRQRAEIDEDERNKRAIELQIRTAHERLKESGGDVDAEVDHSLTRTEEGEKVELSLVASLSNATASKKRPFAATKTNVFQTDSDEEQQESTAPQKKSAALQLIEDEQKKKDKMKTDSYVVEERKSYWLHRNVFVKVVSKTAMGGELYKKKGVVVKVLDKFVAEVDIEGKIYKLDQEELETVIPKVGNVVLILNGKGRSCKAILLKINDDNFNCDVKVIEENSPFFQQDIKGVEYEDLSKYNT